MEFVTRAFFVAHLAVDQGRRQLYATHLTDPGSREMESWSCGAFFSGWFQRSENSQNDVAKPNKLISAESFYRYKSRFLLFFGPQLF